MAKQPIHLKIHQLTKDRIKIEGIAYRNPNNRTETQTIPFWPIPRRKLKARLRTDNEHDCKYNFNYSKAILTVT